MKELFTFKVNKEVVTENKVKNEDGTFTLTEVKELVPTEVFLKQPSRRDREEMTTVYNMEFHHCLSNRINSREMIERAILDANSGYLSGPDRERLFKLNKQKNDKVLEYHLKKLDDELPQELVDEIQAIDKAIYEIESTFKSIFDKSAEAIATQKYISWAALNMVFLKDGKDFRAVFPGPTFLSKLDNYYEMCDEPEKFQFERMCFDKAYVFIQKFLTNEARTKEEFEELEKQIDSFLADETP